MKIAFASKYTRLIQEDSPIEDAQAVFFLSFAFALLLAIKSFKNRFNGLGVVHLILALAFLLVCLEELSWGQRIFHLASGEFFTEHNAQTIEPMH